MIEEVESNINKDSDEGKAYNKQKKNLVEINKGIGEIDAFFEEIYQKATKIIPAGDMHKERVKKPKKQVVKKEEKEVIPIGV